MKKCLHTPVLGTLFLPAEHSKSILPACSCYSLAQWRSQPPFGSPASASSLHHYNTNDIRRKKNTNNKSNNCKATHVSRSQSYLTAGIGKRLKYGFTYPRIPLVQGLYVYKWHFSVWTCHHSIVFTPHHQINIISKFPASIPVYINHLELMSQFLQE